MGCCINNKHKVKVREQLCSCSVYVFCVPGQPWQQQQQQQHVSSAAGLHVSRVSSEFRRYPHTSPAYQSQRTRPYRCRRTHVHQQPGHPHQVPRVTVRDPRQLWKTQNTWLYNSVFSFQIAGIYFNYFQLIGKFKGNYHNDLVHRQKHLNFKGPWLTSK